MKQPQKDKSRAVNSLEGAVGGRFDALQQEQRQQQIESDTKSALTQAAHDEEEKSQKEATRPGFPNGDTHTSLRLRRQHQENSPGVQLLSSGFASPAGQSPQDDRGITALESFLDSPPTCELHLPGEKAAKVMREYLLPMLEAHRFKQSELERRRRLGSPPCRKEREKEAGPRSPPSATCSSAAKRGILSELQLSDALLSELEAMKKRVACLEKCLKTTEAAKQHAETQLTACAASLKKLSIELENTRQKESFSRLHITQTESDCASLRWQLQQLEILISQQHAEQGRLTTRVTALQEANEDLRRKLAVTQNSAIVMRHEHDVLTEQLRGLSEAAKDFPTVKSLQDDLLYEQLLSKAQIEDIQKFSRNLQNECAKLAEERVHLLEEKRDLIMQRDRLSEESTRVRKELDEERQHILKDNSQKNEELDALKKERESMEKHLKDLLEDRDKLKQRIARYRARRRLFEAEQRTCKNCGNDYEESENYNWSCRTHHSGYGGEMWWCCGRLGKNAPGCRFNKHESRDEDELEEEKQEREAAELKLKNQSVICLCCKATGHPASHCPKDPNPRAGAPDVNPKEELRRLEILGNQERSQQRKKCGATIAVELAEKFGLEALRSQPEDEDIFSDLKITSLAQQFVVNMHPAEDNPNHKDVFKILFTCYDEVHAAGVDDSLPNTVPERTSTAGVAI